MMFQLIRSTLTSAILVIAGTLYANEMPVRFTVIGQGPYKQQEIVDLKRQINAENADPVSDFVVFLSGVAQGQHADGRPAGIQVAQSLRTLTLPAFVIPGNNDRRDGPTTDLTWRQWREYFDRFEQHWRERPTALDLTQIDYQPDHAANFAFVHKGVLFLGINLAGHSPDPPLTGYDNWVTDNISRFKETVRAAVLFTRPAPDATYAQFVDTVRTAAAAFGKPMLYIHGGGPAWQHEPGWLQPNLVRIQTDPLDRAEPLRIAVLPDGKSSEMFAFDRQYRRGPYLSMGGPTQMTVVWRAETMTRPTVRVGRTPSTLNRVVNTDAIRIRGTATPMPLHSARPNCRQYEATIDKLQPATHYYYGVFDGPTLVAGADNEHWFRTNPMPGSSSAFRFWVVGDSGTGTQPQADVHNAMLHYIAQTNKRLDFYIHVGDMAYTNGTDFEFEHHFFSPYASTLRNTVCWPTMGNHEGGTSNGRNGVGPYYDAYVLPTRAEVGGEPSGTEAYYSFDYANAHFICLNSHDLSRHSSSTMAQWLNADLESTHADWLIAYWHHPPYTKGSHDSDESQPLIEMREQIMPILEAGGVDVVFTGHSHIYERSMLIDGAYATPTVADNVILDDGDGAPNGDGAYRKSAGLHPHQGTVQVVAGHGGTTLRRRGTSPVMKRVIVEHGSVIVDVHDDILQAIMLNKNGEERDRFSIVKRGRHTPVRIAEPNQLTPFIDYRAVKATITLASVPTATTETVATATVGPLNMPNAIDAEITWPTGANTWIVEPQATTMTIHPNHVASAQFRIRCKQSVFPFAHPELWLTHADNRTRARTRILIPPHRSLTLHPMLRPPTIDGTCNPSEQRGLTHQAEFVAQKGTSLIRQPTEFIAGIHQNRLYLTITNHETAMDQMVLVERQRDDDVWRDHCNELFLQLDGQPTYYQIVINSAGQIFDGRYQHAERDIDWDGDIQVAVTRHARQWTVETSIGLAMLGTLQSGDRLRFNVCRTNPLHGEVSQWSHTNRLGNHAPAYFGTADIR